MGVAGSKDDRGVRVLQALPPGFLDEKGKELRNNLDYCLEKNGWYFTIAGLALSIPICFKYKTERPFYVAALLSPMADMYYGTLRCTEENDAFAKHYRFLHKKYHTPAWKQASLEREEQQFGQEQQLLQRPSDQWQHQQHQQAPSAREQHLAELQQHRQRQQHQQQATDVQWGADTQQHQQQHQQQQQEELDNVHQSPAKSWWWNKRGV